MKPSDCFTQIPADTSKLVDLCMTTIQNAETTSWFDHIGSTRFMFVRNVMDTPTVLNTSDILSELNLRIKIQHIAIIRLKPAEYYRLHTDTVRGVSINMLIQHHHSHCVFVDPVNGKDLIELCYEPGEMYVFNNQIPHTISNFTGDRYMLTVQFQEPKQVLKYADVVRHLKSLQKKSQSPPTQNKY